MPLSDIVNVQISRQTSAVSQAGFGTALIVGTHKRFNDRIKFYGSLSAIADDFDSTDKEYIAAQGLFGQNPTVVQAAIGRIKVDDPVTITIAATADNFDYTVTINGTDLTYPSGVSETVDQIATGVVAAINAGAEPVTATDGSGGNFTVSADVALTPWSLSVGTNITTPAFTVTEAPADTLDAIVDESDDWYGLVWTDRTQAKVEAVQAWVEAVRKIFITASADADIIDTTAAADTTTIAATSKAAAYARSAVMYSAVAATVFPEAALFGKILPRDPGSYTAMFKTLAGITVDTLTDTQSKNALDKNCNVYQEIGGKNITREGKVAEGEYIDVIIFIDWLQARMTERIYAKLVNLPKVPYTDAGVGVVTAEIRAQIREGINRGGLVEDPAPTVTAPLVKDVSPTDKANRLLPDVKFTAVLAGAIHAVDVQGIVTL